MTFRRRLSTALAASMVVALITAFGAILALRLVLEAEQHATAVAHELSLVQEARLRVEELVTASRGYLLIGSAAAGESLDAAEIRLEQTLRELRMDPAERGRLGLMALAERYVAEVRNAARERAVHGEASTMLDVFERRVQPARQQFERAADAYVLEQHAQVEATNSGANAIARRAQLALVGLLVAGVAISIAIAVIVARRLLRQYADVERATETARRAAARRDEVLAIVSHDLRSPLTAVSLGAELLAETAAPDQARVAASVVAAAERMRCLIDELLAREQLETGKLVLEPARLEVPATVATVVALYEQQASARGIAIRTDLASVEVHADRERLIQVLANLVGNAIKFSPAGGTITIAARPDGEAVRFEVADTGPGIPLADQPRLFERYFQGSTSRERGSLGLGLSICKRIVEAHGGTIGVDSTPGQGARFWFAITASRDRRSSPRTAGR